MYCVLPWIKNRSVPGPLWEADNRDHAIDVALDVIRTSYPEDIKTVPEEEIRRELEEDACWASNQGDIWVYILKTEGYTEN